MNPVRIEGATIPLGKPEGWDEGEAGHCSTLWVRPDIDGGLPFLRSAWEVTVNEIGLLLAGAKVQLGVCAKQHPVVNLGLGPAPESYLPPVVVQQTAHHGCPAVMVLMFFPCGQRVKSEATIGADGLGAAVKLAIDEIENFARERKWL